MILLIKYFDQTICATNGAVYYAATPPTPINNIPIEQFATVYPPTAGKINISSFNAIIYNFTFHKFVF